MIKGIVDRNGVPYIEVALAGKSYRATIDTGFNGDFELPHSLRSFVNARWIFEAESMLADSNDILIGTHLLRRYRLSINFVARTVRLQRI